MDRLVYMLVARRWPMLVNCDQSNHSRLARLWVAAEERQVVGLTSPYHSKSPPGVLSAIAVYATCPVS